LSEKAGKKKRHARTLSIGEEEFRSLSAKSRRSDFHWEARRPGVVLGWGRGRLDSFVKIPHFFLWEGEKTRNNTATDRFRKEGKERGRRTETSLPG